MTRLATLALIAGLALGASVLPARAEEAQEPERPWSDTAEFSLVMTSGNSETENVAFSNRYVYTWPEAEFTFLASALRTETTTRLLSNPRGEVEVDEVTAKTAEAYALSGKYRRNIREGFFWYAGLGWDRNEFAGIEDRYRAGAGAGYRIFQTDVHTLIGELGAEYTDESRVGGAEDDSFAGARAFLGYERKLSETATFTSDLEILENLEETSDLRATWVNSLTASLTSKLALKVSYTVLYDGEPVVVTVGGETISDPADPLFPRAPDAEFEFDDVDTILSASLVVNF